MGRPAGYEPAATITTQFTAAAGLDLDIIRKDASTVQLQWPKPGEDSGIKDYTLHKSKLPYFELGDTEVEGITTGFDKTGDPITYDDAVLGDVVDNWFYALQVACENDYESPLSWQVGKFEYELFESFEETDFTWIGIVLDNTMGPALEYASDLEEHIENFNTGGALSVDVLTISEWNPSSQQFTLYPNLDFALDLGKAYQVEVSTNSFQGAIWAQVGKLPPQEVFTYTLHESFEETDFAWVLQPLYMYQITKASELSNEIEEFANPPVEVLTLSEWNGPAQSFTLFEGVNFATRFGYPYLVEVDIIDSYDGTSQWP